MYCKVACAVVPIVSVLCVGCSYLLLFCQVVGCRMFGDVLSCSLSRLVAVCFLDWSLLVVCLALHVIDQVAHGGGLFCAWLFLFVLG